MKTLTLLTTLGLALSTGSTALAQQTFQLDARVASVVDDLGLFAGVQTGDLAFGSIAYDPDAEPLGPVGLFGTAEFDNAAIEATFGGTTYQPLGPAFSSVVVGGGDLEFLPEEIRDILPPEFFGIGVDAFRVFGSIAPDGGATSASITAEFVGPEDWLAPGTLPSPDVFNTEIIQNGTLTVSYANIGLVPAPCSVGDEGLLVTPGEDGPSCFTFDVVTSTAVLEITEISSNGVSLWVNPNLTNTAPTCPGDLDGDGDTNLTDFGIFASEFGRGLSGGGVGCGDSSPCLADFDDDGDVDLDDFGTFGTGFGCEG